MTAARSVDVSTAITLLQRFYTSQSAVLRALPAANASHFVGDVNVPAGLHVFTAQVQLSSRDMNETLLWESGRIFRLC